MNQTLSENSLDFEPKQPNQTLSWNLQLPRPNQPNEPLQTHSLDFTISQAESAPAAPFSEFRSRGTEVPECRGDRGALWCAPFCESARCGMPKSQKHKNSKSTCSSCAPPRDTYSRGAPVPKAALWCALSRAYSVPCDALWCAPLLTCVPIEFTQFEGLKGCVFKPLRG